jgi:ABC-2 type transport system permease protein
MKAAHVEAKEPSQPAGGALTPATRRLRPYLIEAKYESLRMLRSPAFAVPFLALPVLLYLLFGVLLFGDALAKDPKAAWFTFIGFSIMGVMGPGLFGFGITIAVEREQGLLVLKRALPAPFAATLLAKIAMAMLFVTIVMATMALAAPLGHLTPTADALVRISVVNILGAAPFCAMGLFIGTWASAKSAPAFVNLIYLPMIYLSGFLFPLPKSVLWIEHCSPAYYLDQLVLSALGAPSQSSTSVNIAVLAGLTLLLSVLAIYRLTRVG